MNDASPFKIHVTKLLDWNLNIYILKIGFTTENRWIRVDFLELCRG